MVVYKIAHKDFVYIGSTARNVKARVREHTYRLKNPDKQTQSSNTKLYNYLRSEGITHITPDMVSTYPADDFFVKNKLTNLEKEQKEIDKVPEEYCLNSYRAYRKKKNIK